MRRALIAIRLMSPTDVRALAKLSYLLKQLCLMYFPHQSVASLHGRAWLVFLDSVIDFNGFVKKGEPLITDAFRHPDQSMSGHQVIDVSILWCQKLKRSLWRVW